jgi:diguanylate cyclase (GGDEF)-like protein/PAS domain S-box-containing protein
MGRSVLIIEDDKGTQMAYERALRDTDWSIRTAFTLEEGAAELVREAPDAILLDYLLPDGDGLAFLKRVFPSPNTGLPPVIMVTGSGDEAVAVQAMRAGATDYIVKDPRGKHLQRLPWALDRALEETAQRQEKAKTEQLLRLAGHVFQSVTQGILVTDPEGVIVSVNPALCFITGYASHELVGQTPRVLKSGRHPAAFYRDMWEEITAQGRWNGEVWNRRRDGELFLDQVTITGIRDDQGRLRNYVAVHSDITRARLTEEFIRHQAFHDPLTGLPNRSLFMDRLRLNIAQAHRLGTSLALLYLDLDGFKAVNDDLGHAAGDEVLKEAGRRLVAGTRETDTVARLGGDEFTVILTGVLALSEAERVAGNLLESLCLPFQVEGEDRHLGASVGIAFYPEDSLDAGKLLCLADAAMYQAKHAGKGRIATASPGTSPIRFRIPEGGDNGDEHRRDHGRENEDENVPPMDAPGVNHQGDEEDLKGDSRETHGKPEGFPGTSVRHRWLLS